MAQIEPMDIENDFEDKENLLQVNNILLRTSCTEKGYEEMDVSEISMKLRYSITPSSSPMSKSFSGNCDNKIYDTSEAGINDSFVNGNISLTHSLNSTLTKVDNKSSKLCPLQQLAPDILGDINRNPLSQRSLDSNQVDPNITITFNDNLDESLSLPSTSSSTPQTPEAITPTKEMPKDGGSPIMRGLKSVFSMFRSSQSPIAPPEGSNNQTNVINESSYSEEQLEPLPTSVSTPINTLKNKESTTKRKSPLKESLVFNEDLEKELSWKDESTIIFKDEKIPIHKLLLQPPHLDRVEMLRKKCIENENDTAVTFMDLLQNESGFCDKVMTDIESGLTVELSETVGAVESDSEFLDCETTFTKNEQEITESQIYGKTSNTNANETVPTSDNDIEDGTNVESQKLHLVLPNISTSMSSVQVLDSVSPDNVLIEQTVSINNKLGADVSMIIDNIELSESKQEQNNQITISDNNKNNCVALGIKSENLNNNAITTACDSSISSKQIILDAACNEVKELYEINNSSVQDQSSTCVNSSLDAMKIFDTLEIGITEQTTKICEYNNEFSTNTVTDGQYNECLPQIISNEVKTTDLIIDNNISDMNTEKNIINIPCKEQFESENFLDTLIINEQDLHKVLLSSESTLNNHKTHLLDKKIVFEHTSKETNSNLLYKDSKVDVNTNEELKINNTIKNCNNQLNKILVDELNTSINNFQKTFIGDSPAPSCSNNESIFAPTDIPLPCDNELEQDLAIDIKNENLNIVKCQSPETLQLNIESVGCNILCKTPPSHINLLADVIPKEGDTMNETITLEINKKEIDTEKNIAHVISDNTFKINDECAIDDNLNFDDYLHIKSESDPVNRAVNNDNVTWGLPNERKICFSEDTYKQLKEADQNCFENNLSLDLDTKNKNADNNSIQVNHLFETKTDVETISNQGNSVVLDNPNKEDHVDDSLEDEITSNISIVQDRNVNEIVSNKRSLEGRLTIEEDEIIISTSSSPYVSVTEFGLIEHDKDILEEENMNQEHDFSASPSISPQPIKKGYDINFDDIDDPFATKTKIRLSPTPETTTNKSLTSADIFKGKHYKKQASFKNRRKSQPEKKIEKPTKNKNGNLDCALKDEHKEIENNETKDEIKNTDLKFEDVENAIAPIIYNTETPAADINNSMEKNLNVSSVIKDDCIPLTLNNSFVIEPKHFSSLSNLTTVDTNKNDTIELEVTHAIPGIENKGALRETADKYLKSEPQITSVSESNNYPEFSEAIEMSMNLPKQLIGAEVFDQEVENLLQNPELISQPIVTTKTDMSDEITEKSFDSKHAETFTDTKQMEDQAMKKLTSKDNVEPFFLRATNESFQEIKDRSIQEILTEDEDTIEGPLLEADDSSDVINNKKYNSDKNSIVQCDSTSTTAPINDDNADNDELFIDAEAFEFLLNQNKSNVIADSGKESLFLKFDPLFAKRVSSDGILAALSKLQKIKTTPKKISKLANEENLEIETPMPGPSQIDASYVGVDNLEVPSLKPMMVVNPAVNPVVTPRKMTPKLNRRSLTFTSPAIAVIDRLLSLNGNETLIDDTYQHGREHNETDVAIMQLRELLAEKEINVHSLRCESKELKDRLANLESEMKNLETETGDRLRKINDLNERLAEKTKMNKSMAVVVEEYERTIASLISDIQLEKKHNTAERMKLVKERDEQTAHLSSMEVSFSDLHSKYEKSKQIILSMKANEDQYKKSLQEFNESLVKMQSNYEFLKQHATSKLNHANQELEKINKAHESEVLKLNALIKRKELHITSLEETLAQKTKANEELTAICDELINKVG